VPDAEGLEREDRDLAALAVLALLSTGPRHPYDLHRLLTDTGKRFVTVPAFFRGTQCTRPSDVTTPSATYETVASAAEATNRLAKPQPAPASPPSSRSARKAEARRPAVTATVVNPTVTHRVVLPPAVGRNRAKKLTRLICATLAISVMEAISAEARPTTSTGYQRATTIQKANPMIEVAIVDAISVAAVRPTAAPPHARVVAAGPRGS
jgi:hypothetical protein